MKYFCPFLLIGRGRGRGCAQRVGACLGALDQRFLRMFWAKRQAISGGGGGTGRHTLTPSPQAAFTIEMPITRAPTTQKLSLKVQYWPRITSHAPPRAPAFPRPCFSAACYQSVYMKFITKHAADHAQ
jgi:hypothetical protein